MPNRCIRDEPHDGLLGKRVQLVEKDEHEVDPGRVRVGVVHANGLDAALLGALRPPDVELRVLRVRGDLERIELVEVLQDLLWVEACVDGDHGHGGLPGFGDLKGRRAGVGVCHFGGKGARVGARRSGIAGERVVARVVMVVGRIVWDRECGFGAIAVVVMVAGD